MLIDCRDVQYMPTNNAALIAEVAKGDLRIVSLAKRIRHCCRFLWFERRSPNCEDWAVSVSHRHLKLSVR